MEYLHSLFEILQSAKSCLLFPIYSVVYLCQYGLMNIYLILWINKSNLCIHFIVQIFPALDMSISFSKIQIPDMWFFSSLKNFFYAFCRVVLRDNEFLKFICKKTFISPLLKDNFIGHKILSSHFLPKFQIFHSTVFSLNFFLLAVW